MQIPNSKPTLSEILFVPSLYLALPEWQFIRFFSSPPKLGSCWGWRAAGTKSIPRNATICSIGALWFSHIFLLCLFLRHRATLSIACWLQQICYLLSISIPKRRLHPSEKINAPATFFFFFCMFSLSRDLRLYFVPDDDKKTDPPSRDLSFSPTNPYWV